jgi:CRP-like cAMP-binding protein
MNQAELLTSARFTLSGTARRGTPRHDRVLMRSAGGRRRLVLTPEQAAILSDCFSEPSTVPGALVRLLGEHACPPLGEFYELILQAHAAGLLVPNGEREDRSLARRWRVRVPLRTAGWLGQALIITGAVALLIPRWVAPGGWSDWVAGWLAGCVLLSLGEAAAACALAGERSELRAPGVRWPTLLPHFSVDSEEASMDGPDRQAVVAALRAAPVFAGAALVAWRWQEMLAPVLCAVLYVLAPWGGSAALQWVAARRATAIFSVRAGFIFEQRRDDAWEKFREWKRGLTRGFVLHWAAWTLLVALVGVRLFPGATQRIQALLGQAGPLHPLGDAILYTLVAGFVVGCICLAKAFVAHLWIRRKLAQPLRKDSARGPRALAPLTGDPLSILRQVVLFREMAEADLAELVASMRVVQIGRNQDVFREDDPADAFYVVMEGEVEVAKRRPSPSRRVETIGWLGPGSGFGEIALLDGTVRTATVRATRDSRLLRLEKAEFDSLVVKRVGAARVRELLQHVAFLGRLVFLAGWPFDELLRYAQQCSTVRFDAGAAALTKGAPNNWFFLIFDGAFEARNGGRVLRRMQPGDYFGEISLLEGGEATADVVAIEESRCLTMARSDFLRLFASDSRIGMRMESLAARRLGTESFFRH